MAGAAAMAPLAEGHYNVNYKPPRGFDLGGGDVRFLQIQLVDRFRKMATQTNNYITLNGRLQFYNNELLSKDLHNALDDLRDAWDDAMKLIVEIMYLGALPVPPCDHLDAAVQHILGVPRLYQAARERAAAQGPELDSVCQMLVALEDAAPAAQDDREATTATAAKSVQKSSIATQGTLKSSITANKCLGNAKKGPNRAKAPTSTHNDKKEEFAELQAHIAKLEALQRRLHAILDDETTTATQDFTACCSSAATQSAQKPSSSTEDNAKIIVKLIRTGHNYKAIVVQDLQVPNASTAHEEEVCPNSGLEAAQVVPSATD